MVAQKKVDIKYITSQEIVVDLFTKPICKKVYFRLVKPLGLVDVKCTCQCCFFPQMFTCICFLSYNNFPFNSVTRHFFYKTYLNAYVKYIFEYRSMLDKYKIGLLTTDCLCLFMCTKMEQI